MKILKTLYTATLCAAMAVSTSSCLNSWLDQSPADGIDAETAIKNSDDLANVRTGLYAAVKGNSSLINYYGRLMFVYGDMRGEDIQYEYNGGSGRANFYYYMEYTTADNFTTSTAVWQMPYVVIARANRLIQAAESGNLTRQRQKPLLTNMMQKQKFCAPWHCLTLHVSTVNLIR